MRKGPDPDPYFWLIDPYPGGPKTSGSESPTLEGATDFVWNQWRKLADVTIKISRSGNGKGVSRSATTRRHFTLWKITPSLIVHNLWSVRHFNRSFNLIWLFRWSWRHQWRSMTTSRTKFILWKRSTKSALRTRTFGASITRQYLSAFVAAFRIQA
jgi:hypothetical protein